MGGSLTTAESKLMQTTLLSLFYTGWLRNKFECDLIHH